MRALVMKFGGSSVVDAAAIERVISIVSAAHDRGRAPVVVVSAFGGTTDRLLELAGAASRGHGEAVRAGLVGVIDRQRMEAAGLGVGDDRELARAMDTAFAEVRGALERVHDDRTCDPASSDVIAAAGELLSSLIVSAAMAARGLPASWVDARTVIATDARHTCAAPLIDEIAAAAQAIVIPLVDAGRIAVLGGFIGRDARGATTTPGRG